MRTVSYCMCKDSKRATQVPINQCEYLYRKPMKQPTVLCHDVNPLPARFLTFGAQKPFLTGSQCLIVYEKRQHCICKCKHVQQPAYKFCIFWTLRFLHELSGRIRYNRLNLLYNIHRTFHSYCVVVSIFLPFKLAVGISPYRALPSPTRSS